MSLAIGSSNAFALVTGALLLGSGLVEIPRGLWQNADLSHRYRWLLRRVARATQRLDVAHRELSTAIVVSCWIGGCWRAAGTAPCLAYLQSVHCAVPCLYLVSILRRALLISSQCTALCLAHL